MPVLTFDGPPISDIAKKRELIQTATDAAAKAYNLPKQAIIIVLKENRPDNVAVGGELVSDKTKATK